MARPASTPTRRDLTPALIALAARAESVLERLLPADTQAPVQLHRAMRYSTLGGGKRLRPCLAYSAALACGGTLEQADAAGAAVEMIHAYSLIHDDLPAMDDDHLRRGKPTCHIAFGEATAILAGDALQALAFEVLAADQHADRAAVRQVDMLRVLASACGSHGMAGGQAFDLDAVGRALDHVELERMHAHKTGALIRASVHLGALAAGEQDALRIGALLRYGHAVGLAFQIRDDILDIEGDTAVIGKPQGSDAAQNKPTYPAILGLAESRSLAEHLRAEALAALAIFDDRAEHLRDLAHYSVDRVS
ncbi:MAG: polyprenyl synthetase family protein [Rhodanobacteraceae bacterium]|nr:polyprenyl synthetase family protein [Rhodanobacteraceae bacterium]MBL0042391.1 polyprenyl synthetase family protein [Xanthomonadales bacterium]MBP7624314.1 polyprenyl synthetase family protein [Xanthomonadales bacterium]